MQLLLLLLSLVPLHLSRILTVSTNLSISPGDGCVRLSPSTTFIDMAFPSCGGRQCPRCFILDDAVSGNHNLNVLNCGAVSVYPSDKLGPYQISDQHVFEYTFLFSGEHGSWTIGDIVMKGKSVKNLFCFNNEFFEN